MTKKNTFWHRIFLQNPMPVCLLEKETWEVIEANHAFEKLTGYNLAEMLENKMKLENILYKKDLRNFKIRLEHSEEREPLQGELRMISKEHNIKEVQIEIQQIVEESKNFLLCSFYDISHRKEIEEELRQKLQEKHDKIVETAKKILQIKSLLEKLELFPDVLQEVGKCETIEDLSRKLVFLLTQQQGFHYTRCSFFVVEGESINLLASSHDSALHRFDLNKGHKIAQVARGEIKIISPSTGEYAFPIVSPEKIEGVLMVVLEETERSVVIENEHIHQAHCDLLESIGKFLGILLANKKLLQEKNQDYDSLYQIHNKNFFLKKIEEYQKKEIFPCILLFHWEGEELCLPGKKSSQMEYLIGILEQHKPEKSLLFMLNPKELILVVEDTAFSFLEWNKGIRIHFRQCNPPFPVSIGIIKNCHSNVFWETLYDCLDQSFKKGGNRTFFWDIETSQPKEILEKVITKLE